MGGEQSNNNNSQIRQSSLETKAAYSQVKLTSTKIPNNGRSENYAE